MADKLIDKGMKINDIVSKHPSSIEIMMKSGLHCIGCAAAHFENLEEGAKAHGMSDEKVDELIEELNKAAEKESKGKR